MKRMALFLIACLFSITYCGCRLMPSREKTTFMETAYVLEEPVAFDQDRELQDVRLTVTEITREEYDSAQGANVIASRYEEAYYALTFGMKVDGVEYTELITHEIAGSSVYWDRYHFTFELQIGEQSYPCLFRMDLRHNSWDQVGEEHEATSIYVSVKRSVDLADRTTAGRYAELELVCEESLAQ